MTNNKIIVVDFRGKGITSPHGLLNGQTGPLN